MKKFLNMLAILIAVISLTSCTMQSEDKEDLNSSLKETSSTTKPSESNKEELKNLKRDEIVTKVLIGEASTNFIDGELKTEAHEILETEVNDDVTKIYLLTMVGNFGFENGDFCKVAGSGIIPAVITIDKDKNTTIEYPLDGSLYESSLKEMFKEEHISIIKASFDKEHELNKSLQKKEKDQAKEYLKELGRTAEVKNYTEKTLLTDKGVSVEASNSLIETFFKDHSEYPYYIGTREVLEDDKRMVYEMKYDESSSKIIFTKYFYDTKEEVENFSFDSNK